MAADDNNATVAEQAVMRGDSGNWPAGPGPTRGDGSSVCVSGGAQLLRLHHRRNPADFGAYSGG
jgi:hypothetical protein